MMRAGNIVCRGLRQLLTVTGATPNEGSLGGRQVERRVGLADSVGTSN